MEQFIGAYVGKLLLHKKTNTKIISKIVMINKLMPNINLFLAYYRIVKYSRCMAHSTV